LKNKTLLLITFLLCGHFFTGIASAHSNKSFYIMSPRYVEQDITEPFKMGVVNNGRIDINLNGSYTASISINDMNIRNLTITIENGITFIPITFPLPGPNLLHISIEELDVTANVIYYVAGNPM
jgi:hypothetical protein